MKARTRVAALAVAIFAVWLASGTSEAADQTRPTLDDAFRAGQIDHSTLLVQRLAQMMCSEHADARFAPSAGGMCGTPIIGDVMRHYDSLSPPHQSLVDGLLRRPGERPVATAKTAYTRPTGLPDTVSSPSGVFMVHYDGPPSDSTSHAQAQAVAQALDDARAKYGSGAGNLGFRTVDLDGGSGGGKDNGSTQIDLYIDGPLAVSGFAQQEGGSGWLQVRPRSKYNPETGWPGWALDALVGHEYFHLVQGEYEDWGDEDRWLSESTATWAPDHVYGENSHASPEYLVAFFDDDNDLPSIASIDTGSRAPLDYYYTPSAGDPPWRERHVYGAATFFFYLEQKHGASVVEEIWDECTESGVQSIQAMENVLQSKGSSFVEAFDDFAIYAYAVEDDYWPNGFYLPTYPMPNYQLDERDDYYDAWNYYADVFAHAVTSIGAGNEVVGTTGSPPGAWLHRRGRTYVRLTDLPTGSQRLQMDITVKDPTDESEGDWHFQLLTMDSDGYIVNQTGPMAISNSSNNTATRKVLFSNNSWSWSPSLDHIFLVVSRPVVGDAVTDDTPYFPIADDDRKYRFDIDFTEATTLTVNDVSWAGEYYLTQTITVASGKTLEILPGTLIEGEDYRFDVYGTLIVGEGVTFQHGDAEPWWNGIRVYGSLEMSGTTANPITMTGTATPIAVYSSGTVDISNVNISTSGFSNAKGFYSSGSGGLTLDGVSVTTTTSSSTPFYISTASSTVIEMDNCKATYTSTGNPNDAFYINADNSTVDLDQCLATQTSSGKWRDGFDIDGDDVFLEDCKSYDPYTDGFNVYCTNALATRCTTYSAGRYGFYINGSAGYIYDAIELIDVRSTHNASTGVHLVGNGGDGKMHHVTSTDNYGNGAYLYDLQPYVTLGGYGSSSYNDNLGSGLVVDDCPIGSIEYATMDENAYDDGAGLLVSSSGPYLWNTNIRNNYSWGVRCVSGANPCFMRWSGSAVDFNGENVVRNNDSYGVYIDGQSEPVLGDVLLYTGGGQNSIHSNSYRQVVSFNTGETIKGEGNYWGGTPPGSFFYGSVDYSHHEATDPNSPRKQARRVDEADTLTVMPPTSAADGLAWRALTAADRLVHLGERSDALLQYEAVVTRPDGGSARPIALLHMHDAAGRDETLLEQWRTLARAVDDESGDLGAVALWRLGMDLRRSGRTSEALEAYDGAVAAAPGRWVAAKALYAKWNALMPDTTAAGAVRDQFMVLFPDHRLAFEIDPALRIERTKIALARRADEEALEEVEGANEADLASAPLLAADPNPFNPSTTLTYRVDQLGAVNLSVYNVSGQLVRELVSRSEHQPGLHTAVWNSTDASGREVATGVHLVRLSTPEMTVTQRVTLLR